ncbi:zinc metalloprotease [Mumia sp. Pv 4-285]|uniref:zinc metalloprotease n=1 Tax=Mumia qirimensis TaxID=3234852 RepID=UPI00351CCE71
MPDRRRRVHTRAYGVGLLAALLVAGLFSATSSAAARQPATADSDGRLGATTPRAHASDDCDPAEALAARAIKGVDGVVRGPEPSAATIEAYERDFARRAAALDAARTGSGDKGDAGDAPRRITVNVYAHVIKPSAGSKTVSRAKVRRQIKIVNRAFAGKQWGPARTTRIRFKLKSTGYTVNRAWYYAGLGSKESRQMRKALHRGKKRTLNLYIGAPTVQGDLQVLGYATFPQRPASKLATDGVVIHRGTLPGGGFRRYNKGDTAVHEIGHWLGLYHTFQGGCGKKGDRVADTPRERIPSFECPRGRDTCPSPGEDPIHNFMDYSYDRCMHHFTAGQTERMRKLWRVYRR